MAPRARRLQRAAFVRLVAEGGRAQFANAQWRRELASWMRPRRMGDGLVVRELAAPVTRFVVGHLDVGRATAARDATLAKAAPVLAVLGTDADAVPDWLQAGQALQRLLLTATRRGRSSRGGVDRWLLALSFPIVSEA